MGNYHCLSQISKILTLLLWQDCKIEKLLRWTNPNSNDQLYDQKTKYKKKNKRNIKRQNDSFGFYQETSTLMSVFLQNKELEISYRISKQMQKS